MSQNISQTNTGSAMASCPVYPGYVLKVGSSGSNVAIMQSYLNAIKQGMYPSLTRLTVDGKYGNATKNTVMQYQNLSGLKADGMIGSITWNSIVSDYESLPVPDPDKYPGYVLKSGSSGPHVMTMQNKLNKIATLYMDINGQTVDGKYGQNMTNAVRRFQKQFGLTADGEIGQNTWNKIIAVYNGVINSSPLKVSTAYTGKNYASGSRGDEVRSIQSYLNRISKFYSYGWAPLAVDGVFGRSTKQVVRLFQTKYQLTADGVVGRDTWSKLTNGFNEVV